MAIADRVVATSDGTGSTLTYAHAVAGASGRCLWVYVNNWQSNGGDIPNSVTYGGVALTQIGNFMAGTGNDNSVSLWRLINPPAGSANVVVTFPNSHELVAMSISYSGVDQTTPNDAVSINDVTTTNPSRSIVSATGDMVVDFVGWWSGAGATATGAATERLENFNAGGVNSCAVADAPGAASVTMGWTLDGAPGDRHGQIGFNVNQATADLPPNQGAATGAVTWAGSATGVRRPKGSATGAVAWAGSATGARASRGAATGAVAWVGSATGEAPSIPPSTGSATGEITWSGSATGAMSPKGSATGAVGWVGSATGARRSLGSAAGAVTWAGSATGSRPSRGSAAGAVAWSGSATGARRSAGSAAGEVTWSGSATGEAPVVGGASGSASGSITWTGSATGARPSLGSATGSVEWTGSATGEAPAIGQSTGSATGAVTWAGSATGVRHPKGSATGAINWPGSALGVRRSLGSAAGTVGWAGTAFGVAPGESLVRIEPRPDAIRVGDVPIFKVYVGSTQFWP